MLPRLGHGLFAIAVLLGTGVIRGEDEGLRGKVMCGYQGWFRVPDDETGNGWRHYGSRNTFDPDHCTIDLWPDVDELPEADRFPTPFRYDDGRVAHVFSSVRPGTTDVHFRWMKEYGIDGVFLQRFATSTLSDRLRKSLDTVLANVQRSARKHGRRWVLMYDLSGTRANFVETVVADWNHVRSSLYVADADRDPAYLSHRDKPLVALWGLGFSDREPRLDEWARLIDFFRERGCSVMVGVPTYWRTLRRDAIDDERLHRLIAKVDVVSPWTVGRYNSPDAMARFARETVRLDLAWCRERNVDYLPVAFPGFSWQNLKRTRGEQADLDAIPRRGGEFLWSQFWQYHEAGATMQYVAMFDELDEGTAIFKVRSDTPVGRARFVSEPNVPGDRYLRLTGAAGRLLRGDRSLSATMPVR